MKSRITTQRAPMSTSNIRRFNLSEPHRAANEARGMLRHPRSLIRITPGWCAPPLCVASGWLHCAGPCFTAQNVAVDVAPTKSAAAARRRGSVPGHGLRGMSEVDD